MRFFRALLLLYPASFRAEYGEEMRRIFRRRLRDASGLAVVTILVEAVAETVYNAAGVHWDILCQDLRYAARTLRRAPGFTVTAVLVTSLGIGATTAAFSIADPILIRKPPFTDAERLVRLWETRSGMPAFEVSPADYRDWKRASRALEAMGCFRSIAANLTGADGPGRVEGAEVTAEVLPLLQEQAVAGSLLTANDHRSDTPPVLIREDFALGIGGRFGAVGKRILLDGIPYTVAGVLPLDFRFPGSDTVYWKLMQLGEEDFAFRNDRRLQVIAKLRRGVTIAAARRELTGIAQEIERRHPRENKGIGAQVTEFSFDIEPQTKLLVIGLFAAACCLFLIVCANLTNLLFARALSRSGEMAVRTAIGGGRQRLVRQLMTEGILLVCLGGGVGVILASGVVPVFARLAPATASLPIAIDWRVMLFAAVVTVVAGAVFGIIPALCVSAGAERRSLRASAESSAYNGERVRSALVVFEVAGSLVLLVSSGLLLQTLWKLRSVAPGFQADQVVTMRTALPMPRYAGSAQRQQFYTRVLKSIRQLPGVSSAGYITFLPMTMRGGMWPVRLSEHDLDSGMAIVRFVTAGFFETLRVPIVQGRSVSDSDTSDGPPVAVVSESFVLRYWPHSNPLGQTFQCGAMERLVIGVTGDIRIRGLEVASEPQVYMPYQQVPDGAALFWAPKDLVIRTNIRPEELAPRVRDIVRAVDTEQPVSEVRLLSGIVNRETNPRAIQAGVIGAFAAISIVVAMIGMSGFISFAISKRAQEIGIRIALGAQPKQILRAVLFRGLALGAVGIAVGAVASVPVASIMRSLLWGVAPNDPLAICTAVTLTLAVTLSATAVPAIRAARLDPITQIRSD
jgi:predicted permease